MERPGGENVNLVSGEIEIGKRLGDAEKGAGVDGGNGIVRQIQTPQRRTTESAWGKKGKGKEWGHYGPEQPRIQTGPVND